VPAYYSDVPSFSNAPVISAPLQGGTGTPVEANKAPLTNPGEGVQPSSGDPQANPSESQGTANPGDARLRLRLPEDAVVFVNGRKTKTTGELRSYVSRDLLANRTYTYEVKAVVTRDGEQRVQTKVVDLTAGIDKLVGFDFDGSSELLTSLSLNVPEDAKVVLGGSETGASGSFRYFSTKALSQGQVWSGYAVVVSVVRDGKEVSQRQVIDLAAGESRQLDFDFDAPALVASK
jgi:uncharacterized protein (TIGR03000 family)